MRIEYIKETESTNEYIKRYLEDGEDRIVYAERQTKGRGTNGRLFISEEGGVYLSFLTFYRNYSSNLAFERMMHAAVAVCKALETFGVEPKIKWPNDIYLKGKKLCGILIENLFSGGKLRASIVGIGINVLNDLTGLEGIATSLSKELNTPPDPNQVRDAVIANFQQKTSFKDYLGYINFLGQQILVIEGDRKFSAMARQILPDGRLEIEEKGEIRALSSAEIRIRVTE